MITLIEVLDIIETTDIPGVDSYIKFKIGSRLLVGFLPEIGDYSQLKGKKVKARLKILSFKDTKVSENVPTISTGDNGHTSYTGKILSVLRNGKYLFDCGLKLELSTKNRYKNGDWVSGEGRLDVYIE